MPSTNPAPSLVERLDLSLRDVMLCPMCLGAIAVEVAHGDAESLRQALRMFVPLLWAEGLETVLRDALDRARRDGVPGSAEALSVVDRRGERAPVVELTVLHFARELARRVEAAGRAAAN